MMNKEEWKEITGYSRYKAASFGDIWDKEENRFVTKYDCDGYYIISLKSDDGKWHTGIKLHKLIAKLFIPNPENKKEVHHIDCNSYHNSIDNLMWVTRQEHFELHDNLLDRRQKISEKLTNGKTSKKVYQYALDGSFIKEWVSLSEAARQLNIGVSEISSCCKGNVVTVDNYQWRYEKYDRIAPVKSRIERIASAMEKPINQKTLDGVFIKKWKSLSEIHRQLNYSIGNISSCCNKRKGYKTYKNCLWEWA